MTESLTTAWKEIALGFLKGIVPGVIGVMAVALVRMTPSAAPDPLAMAVLIVTGAALILWRVAPLKVMLGGAVFGILRDRVLVWGR